jgi:hypothetical protein
MNQAVKAPYTAEIEGRVLLERDAWFDPWRRPRGTTAKAIVAEVVNELGNYERHFGLRKRRRRPDDQNTFEESVAAVVSNLMHRELTQTGGKLAVSLSHQVLGRAGRYRSQVLSKVFPELLERMASREMDWLRLKKGEQKPFGLARATTIQATPRLLRRMTDRAIGFEDLHRVKGGEVLILKRSKDDAEDAGDYLDYTDTAETRAFRKEIERINRWLEDAEIDFDDFTAPDKAVDPSERRLLRYFNNGSFEEGGRLFGGFWQGLKKRERREGIMIDGEAVVTLDFAQMAPRILYGMVGVSPPEGDIYQIPGFGRYREGVKKLFAAAMFSAEAFRRVPQGTRKLLPEDMPVGMMVEQIKTHHRPIAHLLFTGVGFKEMFRESEILIDALLALIDKGVVALPIHDALVVPYSKLALVRDTMLNVFREHTGVEGQVSLEGSD